MLIISIVVGAVLVLVVTGGFLIWVEREYGIVTDLIPKAPSTPVGVIEFGNGVSVVQLSEWTIEESTETDVRLERGWQTFSANSTTELSVRPAESCDGHVRSMASHGIASPTFTPAKIIKSSGSALLVECEVTGMATGIFGSGPLGIRTYVAVNGDDVWVRGSLRYHPGETGDWIWPDYTAMVDSIWESMLD